MKKFNKNLSMFVFVLFLGIGLVFSTQKIFAATGGGTATIAKDGGASGTGVTVDVSTSHIFTVVLTIPTGGMTLGASSPTFAIPAGFTAPNAHSVANAGLVDTDGKWSVVGAGGGCTVDSSPVSSTTTATGQVITVDITADCAVNDTITLTYKGTSGITMGATALTVSTANAGDTSPVTPLVAGSPTITVIGDTTAPTVAVTMDDVALNIGDTALVTFTFSEAPVGFTTADVTVANGSIGAIDASNPLVQTAAYTPTNGITDATNIITVGAGWTDAALNAGVGDDSPNYTIDTIATTTTPSGSGGLVVLPIPPLIDVVKIPSPLALPAGPGLVTYTYTLRNIGTVPVNNIKMVGDTCSPIVLASGDVNNNAILEVSEIWVYRCATTISQTHTNIVTTTGWANGISAVDVASATVVVGVAVVPPLIHMTKVPDVFTLSAPGGVVTYAYTVNNPGTVPLNNVSITDDKCTGLPGRVLGHPGDLNKNDLLESNEIWRFTCETNLSQTTKNTGTAEGSANGLTARDSASATVVVSSAVFPVLPNTGFPPRRNITLLLLVGIFMTSLVFYIIYKKRDESLAN